MQELGYDGAGSVTGHVPQYSGLVTLKDETWFSEGVAPVTSAKIYRYDYAGRLSFEGVQSGTSYTYDARGNMLTYGIAPSITPRNTLDYSGDRLTTLSRYRKDDVYFTYDSFGRMISDGLNDTQMEYNFLNLVRKVSSDSTVLVNYFYLADGTKLSASDGDGEGLVYRGPFVYRHSAGPLRRVCATVKSSYRQARQCCPVCTELPFLCARW